MQVLCILKDKPVSNFQIVGHYSDLLYNIFKLWTQNITSAKIDERIYMVLLQNIPVLYANYFGKNFFWSPLIFLEEQPLKGI